MAQNVIQGLGRRLEDRNQAQTKETGLEQLSFFPHPRKDPEFPGAAWDLTGAGEPDMVD